MNSPLIANGALSLNANGDLQAAPDIETQMTVGLSGYNCLFDANLNSALIPYLLGLPKGGRNINALKNIVVQAYSSMIQQNIITNLQISFPFPQLINSVVYINISATDAQGNNITLNWMNPQ